MVVLSSKMPMQGCRKDLAVRYTLAYYDKPRILVHLTDQSYLSLWCNKSRLMWKSAKAVIYVNSFANENAMDQYLKWKKIHDIKIKI